MKTLLSKKGRYSSMPGFVGETEHGYLAEDCPISADAIIESAKTLIKKRLNNSKYIFKDPEDVASFLKLEYAEKEYECFVVVFLTKDHRLIKAVEMFTGTIDAATIHYREVLKLALKLNAATVIFSHNHPSGSAKPSQEDIVFTKSISKALEIVEIKVLDHIIIGGISYYSLAEKGEI